jgi:hypothetical protein
MRPFHNLFITESVTVKSLFNIMYIREITTMYELGVTRYSVYNVECLLRTVSEARWGEGDVRELDCVGRFAVAMQAMRMCRGYFALSTD